jgi:hypothetical protein
MLKMLKTPVLKIELSRIYFLKIYLHKMSNSTKWTTCRWNIDFFFKLNGALKNIYVLSNYECYNHNISKF